MKLALVIAEFLLCTAALASVPSPTSWRNGQACYRETEIGAFARKTRERIEVARARVEFEKLAEEGVFSNFEWSVAVSRLEDLSSHFVTMEGHVSAEERIGRIKRMKTLHDILVANVTGYVFKGLKVVGADEHCIRCAWCGLPYEEPISITWKQFLLDYTSDFDDLVGGLVVKGRRRARLKFREWIYAMTGAVVLYRKTFSDSEWAKNRVAQLLTTLRREWPDAEEQDPESFHLERFVDSDGVLTEDYAIRLRLAEAGCAVGNEGVLSRLYQVAIDAAGGEKGKVESVARELARTNDAQIASCMVRVLGSCGSERQVPYLYSCVTNPLVATAAIESILNRRGIMSGTVTALGQYMGVEGVKAYDKTEVLRDAIAGFRAQQPSAALSNEFTNCLLSSALSNNVSAVAFDENLKHFDPSYAMSARRLRVLRSVQSMGLNATQSAYVTNAINELVAYPEANLPE